MLFTGIKFYLHLAWLYTVICWIVAIFCRYHPTDRRGGLGQPLPNPISLILPILLFVPFSGLRTESGDTWFYIHDFDIIKPDGVISYEIGGGFAYPLFQEIIKETTNDVHHLMMITAIISLVPVLFILYKYSHPYDLSIYLFMATGYFGLSLNGIRQYMATGVLMLGTRFMFSEKKTSILKYAVIVYLAFLFHKSAPFMLFVFIFVRRKAWRPSSFMLMFLSIVVLALFDLLLPSFLKGLEQTDFAGYSENGWFTSGEEKGSNFVRVLVSGVPIVLAYFSRSRTRQLGFVGDVLINLGFINMAIYVLSTYNWIFARLAIYLSVYYIILLAWVAYNGVRPKDKGLYYTACVMLYYYYSTYLSYGILTYVSDRYFPERKFF
ncbi:MAG: EpsG family protein [Clostridia bacterium]|nr:EpsG family protein [Clostridia bacterium]